MRYQEPKIDNELEDDDDELDNDDSVEQDDDYFKDEDEGAPNIEDDPASEDAAYKQAQVSKELLDETLAVDRDDDDDDFDLDLTPKNINEVEVQTTETAFEARIKVEGGIANKNIQISAERRKLFVRISPKTAGLESGSFSRSFPLPLTANTRRISYKYSQGKLVITVPLKA